MEEPTVSNVWFSNTDNSIVFDLNGYIVARILRRDKNIAKVVASAPDLLQVLNIIIANAATTHNDSIDILRNKLSIIDRYARNAIDVLK